MTNTKELQLAHDGGSKLTDDKLADLSDLLRNSKGTSSISLGKRALLMDFVCSAIASYLPGADYVAFIVSIRLLIAHIQADQAHLISHYHTRKIPLMSLLKMATLRLTRADRWNLAYFFRLIAKKIDSSFIQVSKRIRPIWRKLVHASTDRTCGRCLTPWKHSAWRYGDLQIR